MAGEKVMSGDLRLKLEDKTVFHATSCTLTMSREFKERATKDTTGVERAKSTKSFTASYEGLAVYASDGVGTHDFEDLFGLYNDDAAAALDIEFLPSESDATKKYTGECFIENLELTAPNDEDATISMSLVGNGALQIANII